MSERLIKSRQGDTMDSIAHRNYRSDSVAVLPLLIAANPTFAGLVVLSENSTVKLPDQPNKTIQLQTLKLWD